MDEPLFGGYEPPPPPLAPDKSLSAGRRLTLRQAADIQQGRHPLTGGQLHPEASRYANKEDGTKQQFTCGTCTFREVFSYHNGAYPKCTHPQVGRIAHSAQSDVRAWWPACGQYEGRSDG